MYDLDSPAESQWVSIVPSKGRKAIRLFCFPFAGGGSAIFYSWKDHLSCDIELARIQLPGREIRLRETAFTRMGPLIAQLTEAIAPWLDRPFAFFGHSMGALIAFELARAFKRRYNVLPFHLFVSGFRAPQLPRCRKISGLPDVRFIEGLREYGGIPELVVQNPEMMEIFLPIFRADFEILDNYVYHPTAPLECSITAFGGESDPKVSRNEVMEWKIHTFREFNCHFFFGGHFFLNESRPNFFDRLNDGLVGAFRPKISE